MTISFDLEFKALKEKLEHFEQEMPKTIVKKMMTAAFSKMRQEARNIAPVKTGRLKSSINYWAFKDWSGSLTSWPKSKKGGKNTGFHASFIEDGVQRNQAKADGTKDIRFINKKGTPVIYENKYMTFKINGEWKKVSAVNSRPKRPFMRPTFDRYFGGNAELGIKLMDQKLQQEMNRILNDNGGKT